jgi:CheY-like chemotaxis protein
MAARPRVLLVEDDTETREMFGQALIAAGMDVIGAASAQAGMLQIEMARPDLLVVDLDLPDADGWTLLEAVRGLPASSGGLVPAIAVTALNERDDRRRSMHAGFVLHVAKPIDGPALARVVTGVLAK